MTSRKGEGVFGMLCGGGEGGSLGNVTAGVCRDALATSCGSSVVCCASSGDKMVPGPFSGGSVVGGVLFTFEF